MIKGIESVIIIFIIMAIGFIFTKKKWLPPGSNKALANLVVKIAAPCLAVVSIADRCTIEMLFSSIRYLVIAFSVIFILFGVSSLISRFLKISKQRKAIFKVMFTFNNTIFIGLPINEIVFGQEGLPYLFMYYVATLTMFWTLGNFVIVKASEQYNQKLKPGQMIKSVISPGLVGVIVGFVLVVTEYEVPYFLWETVTYLSELCVPLSLIMIGINIAEIKGFALNTSIDELLVIGSKFIITPLIMLALLSIFGISRGLDWNVFMLTASMPCHTQTVILAEYYDTDPVYASKLITQTTLISLITIPIFSALLS